MALISSPSEEASFTDGSNLLRCGAWALRQSLACQVADYDWEPCFEFEGRQSAFAGWEHWRWWLRGAERFQLNSTVQCPHHSHFQVPRSCYYRFHLHSTSQMAHRCCFRDSLWSASFRRSFSVVLLSATRCPVQRHCLGYWSGLGHHCCHWDVQSLTCSRSCQRDAVTAIS